MRFRTIQAGPLMQMPVFLILFFAPVYVPLNLLEGWIHGVASVNPITYLLETGRGFVAGDPPHIAGAFAIREGAWKLCLSSVRSGRSDVIAWKASHARTMRDSSGICSPTS